MNDNRRDFIKKGVTLAAMSVGGIGPALSKALDPETKDRITSALNEPGKKINDQNCDATECPGPFGYADFL